MKTRGLESVISGGEFADECGRCNSEDGRFSELPALDAPAAITRRARGELSTAFLPTYECSRVAHRITDFCYRKRGGSV
jgi:hypothetical protein